MVAVPLALVDLSTCWVIVHQETYILLRHGVKGFRLVERRSLHYHAVSVIVVKQCPTARRVKTQFVCNSCIERTGPSTHLHERPGQTVILG